MDISDIAPYLEYNFKSDEELIKSINEISDNFTVKRGNMDKYTLTSRDVSAYSLFYLLTNAPKLEKVMSYIGLPATDLAQAEIVDFGSGPGTFLLAFLKILPKNQYYGVEKSKLMKEQSMKLVSSLYPSSNVSVLEKAKQLPAKNVERFGLFGHSANEMSVNEVIHSITSAQLDHVLFIEPGTKEFFKKSLMIREKLLKSDFNIHYPCKSQSVCPLSDQDWCHQYIKIELPPEIKRLCQKAKKDRSLLPLTIQYFSKEKIKNNNDESRRIIRMYKPSKFAVELDTCKNSNGENKIEKVQHLTKGMSKSDVKSLATLFSGEQIRLSDEVYINDGTVRGKIGKA